MHQAIIFVSCLAVNPRLRISEGYCTQSVCVCVCVCPLVFSVALSVKRGHVGR